MSPFFLFILFTIPSIVAQTTHLHFFFHDILSGKTPTAVPIIGTRSSGFGTTLMIDDALTEKQDPTSKIIGRAQGLYSVATQQEAALLMVMNFVFTEEDKYKGSSVTIVGRNPVMNDVREMPILGGTGVFRLARGYVTAHTVWSDANTGDAIIEYNVYVTQASSVASSSSSVSLVFSYASLLLVLGATCLPTLISVKIICW